MGGSLSFIKRVLTVRYISALIFSSTHHNLLEQYPAIHPSPSWCETPKIRHPLRNHPEVEVYSIAGRSRERVERFARKRGIETVFSGPDEYQTNLFLTAVADILN